MSDRAIIVFCGLLMALTAFSIDITLPFFATMRDGLGATDSQTHATITLNIFCLGLGQLVFGSYSDRFGRRPVLAVGLTVYLLGTLLALASQTMSGLLLGRALQGLGAAVGPVLGRAMIRDVSSSRDLPQNMAVASGIFSVGPMFAPVIGVGIATLGGGWRSIFVAMGLFALALLMMLVRLPETLSERQVDALTLPRIAANIRAVLRHPQSRYFIGVASVAMIAIVMVVSGAARVFEVEFGVTGFVFALLFGMHGLGIIVGQTLNHRMIGRIGPVPSAIVASVIVSVALGALTLLAGLGWLNAPVAALLLALFAVGYLIVFSNATSMALEPHPRIAGFTASFYGFVAQATSAGIGTLLVSATAHSAFAWSLAMLVVALILFGALVFWYRAR